MTVKSQVSWSSLSVHETTVVGYSVSDPEDLLMMICSCTPTLSPTSIIQLRQSVKGMTHRLDWLIRE